MLGDPVSVADTCLLAGFVAAMTVNAVLGYWLYLAS
jgi:hypothetical protein